jgi:hypothetical protein
MEGSLGGFDALGNARRTRYTRTQWPRRRGGGEGEEESVEGPRASYRAIWRVLFAQLCGRWGL